MRTIEGVHIAPNWTSAAGAVEGILEFLGAALPRHAIMGLTGHAWHTCLGSREGVVALPNGPLDLDWAVMSQNYARTGIAWERFPAESSPTPRDAAIEWTIQQLDVGRPIAGFDFLLHEFSVVYGYDRTAEQFLVDNVLTQEVGPMAPWRDWPSVAGSIELIAPAGPAGLDLIASITGALESAVSAFDGRDGPADGQPRGTAALDAWADALDGDTVVDRAGNAYTLAVLQAARLDGAAFLANITESLPPLAAPLRDAEQAVRAETQALSPLLTLFPFPTGGHGNVSNPGLREAAAMALRRAAGHERAAAAAIAAALSALRDVE